MGANGKSTKPVVSCHKGCHCEPCSCLQGIECVHLCTSQLVINSMLAECFAMVRGLPPRQSGHSTLLDGCKLSRCNNMLR